MSGLRVGLALCGSFCTLTRAVEAAQSLAENYELTAIMSERAAGTDTRFGKAEDFRARLEEITGRSVIATVAEAEPIGPKKALDVLVVAPCTGGTLAKLACGVTDTSVTMAVKAHLRNERPVVIAVSTNDGLSASAVNIGELLARRNIYFVPFGQDDPIKKPRSLVADFSRIGDAVEAAAEGRQLQPILL